MTLKKGSKPNEFDLQGVTFQEIVLIKKACAAYATQGSSGATQIVQKLDEALDRFWYGRRF